jgi:hypothetical protein
MPRLPAVPEVLEVELTRRAAGGLVGRRLLAIERTDPLIVADGVDEVLPGCTVTAVTVLLDQTAVAGLGTCSSTRSCGGPGSTRGARRPH